MSPPKKKVIPPHYLTAREVATRYKVAKNTIWRWVREGRLPAPLKLSDRCTRWDERGLDKHDDTGKA